MLEGVFLCLKLQERARKQIKKSLRILKSCKKYKLKKRINSLNSGKNESQVELNRLKASNI